MLVVDSQTNARLSATRSEILAFGIGLEVASRIYATPYQLWEGSPGLSLHDIQTYNAAGSLIHVELRGRIDRKNMTSAVNEVHEKFANGDFSSAAGIIVFPRTTNTSRSAEIMILDPPGDRLNENSSSRLRILLRHYAPFFYYQDGLVRRFGERMREISYSPDQEFEQYLSHGDQELLGISIKSARTGFTQDGIRYIGTFWNGIYWPEWLVGMRSPSGGGAFFWGLRKEVVEDIRHGRLTGLLTFEVKAMVRKDERRLVVLLEDGPGIIWVPSTDDLFHES
ncbi:MAG: hypothetical protein JWQ42_1927 [Edaphobacter sp.]|nr:hypothetical protein [Edaphobacter sp.]